jgi:hypothetical protein
MQAARLMTLIGSSAVTATALWHCSPFSGQTTDTAPSDEASIDAGADGYATTEASISTDATVGVDAGRYCQTLGMNAQFCADFDDPDAAAAMPFKADLGNGGAIDLAPGGYSPPNAFRSQMPANGAAYAVGNSPSFAASNKVSFHAKVRVDTMPHHANVSLFKIKQTSGEILLTLTAPNSLEVYAVAGPAQTDLGLTTITPGWHDLIIDLNTAAFELTATLDGTAFIVASTKKPTGWPMTSPTANVSVGFDYSDNGPPSDITVLFDDVALFAQ